MKERNLPPTIDRLKSHPYDLRESDIQLAQDFNQCINHISPRSVQLLFSFALVAVRVAFQLN